VSPLRRWLRGSIAAVAIGGAVAGLAQPASADPIWQLHYPNTTGTTHLAKPNVTAAIPKSTVDASLDLATGKMTGQVQVPDFPVTIRLLNAVPVTAVTRLVPVGPLTGTLNGTLTTTTTFTLRLIKVYQPALPKLNLVPSTCRTASATTATLTNTTPVGLFDTTVAGTYTIPKFTGCGALTPVLDLLLSGPGNGLTLRLLA
jgi:hypothetical protein